MADLRLFAQMAAAAAERKIKNPLDYIKLTEPQRHWLSDPSQVKLFRAGNQIGKTYAQALEVLWRCLGCHPFYQTQRPPIEAWVICHSWEQSISVQHKIWALTPRAAVHPSTVFTPGRGFKGKVPVVRFQNGSLLRIKTTNQGTLGLASSTIHYVGIDEPPPPDIWGELNLRVLRNRGCIGMTLPPVGRPVQWLKALVEEGVIAEHHYALTPENVTPVGSLYPMLTADEIETQRNLLLPFERAQRIDGAWEGAPEGRVFMAYDPDTMLGDYLPTGEVQIGIGIDHGAGAGKQAAVLVAVERLGLGRGRVWVLDESISDGTTDPDRDARAIIQMLARHQLTLQDVDLWRGDRPYSGRRGVGSKSNMLLERALRHVSGKPRIKLGILHPRKFSGSVEYGCRVLHSCMINEEFWVRPEAQEINKSLGLWEGADDDLKHVLDGLRYIVVDMLGKRFSAARNVRIY